MADLPSFVGTAQVNPGPMVDTPDVYSGYSKMFGDIEKATRPVAQAFADQQAKQQGELAGQQLDFKTAAPIGEASKQFNQVGLLANRYTAGADIINKVQQYEQEAHQDIMNGDEAVSNFRDKVSYFANGQLSALPPENRMYAANMLAHQSTHAELRIQKALQARNQQLGTAKLKETNFTYGNEISNLAASGDMHGATTYYTQAKSAVYGLYENGAIKPAEYVASNQHFDQIYHQAHYENGLKAILNEPSDNSLTDGGLANRLDKANNYIKSLSKDPGMTAMFNSNQISTMQKNAENIMQTHLQTVGLDKKHLQNTIQNYYHNIYQSGQPDAEKEAEIDEALPNPEDKQKFNDMSYAYQNAGAELNQVKNATIPVANKLIQNLQQRAAKQVDWTDPNASDKQKLYTKQLKDAQEVQKQLLTDPTSLINQDPGYQKLLAQHEAEPDIVSEPMLQQYKLNWMQEKGYAQSQMKFLSKPYEQSLLGQFNVQDTMQNTQLVRQMREKAGSPFIFNSMMNQLSKNGLPQSARSIASVEGNPAIQSESINVQAALGTPVKDWKKSMDDQWKPLTTAVDSEAQKTFQLFHNNPLYMDSRGAASKIFKTQTSQAYQLASYYVTNKGMSTDDAATKAVNVLIGSHYNPGSYNGENFALPRVDDNGNAIDPLTANAALKVKVAKVLNSNNLVIDPDDVSNQNPENQRSTYISHVLSSGYFQNTTAGLQLTYNGKPVMMNEPGKEEPQPVIVPNTDLGDPQSKINVDLQKEVSHVRSVEIPKGNHLFPVPQQGVSLGDNPFKLAGPPKVSNLTDDQIKQIIINRSQINNIHDLRARKSARETGLIYGAQHMIRFLPGMDSPLFNPYLKGEKGAKARKDLLP